MELIIKKIIEALEISDDIAENIELQVRLSNAVNRIDLEKILDEELSEAKERISEKTLNELEKEVSELVNKYICFNEESDDMKIYRIQQIRRQCKKAMLVLLLHAIEEANFL